jgi:hypothetical protein
MTIKNDKQVYYNQVRGNIIELNDNGKHQSITLSVGHEKKREINLSCKQETYEQIVKSYKIGDFVTIRFFLSSRYIMGNWFTLANVLEIA